MAHDTIPMRLRRKWFESSRLQMLRLHNPPIDPEVGCAMFCRCRAQATSVAITRAPCAASVPSPVQLISRNRHVRAAHVRRWTCCHGARTTADMWLQIPWCTDHRGTKGTSWSRTGQPSGPRGLTMRPRIACVASMDRWIDAACHSVCRAPSIPVGQSGPAVRRTQSRARGGSTG